MTTDYDIAKMVTGSERAEGGVHHIESAVILGEAVEDSVDGMVRVIPYGDVFAPSSDNTVTIPTSPSVKAGDIVQIGLVGGVSKRPMVMAVSGEGDLQNVRIGAIEADYVKASQLDVQVANIADARIAQATIQQAQVHNLSTDFAHITNGAIDNANIDYANVSNLDTNYAKIDATNINTAVIREGWFNQVMVQTGMIVSESSIFYLDAIEVKASSITAGTLDVERLIVTQTDQQGHQQKYLVHIDPSTSQPTYEKLDGNIIKDLTITADKIVAGAITAEKITTDNISGTGGWINLRNGTFQYMNATTGDGISWDGSHLTISAESLSLLVQESSQPNLSPYFSYEEGNVYDATTNPDGYWRSINSSYLEPRENGWVHVERANSGSSAIYVWCAPSAEWQQAHAKLIENGTYTVVAECRNCESTGSPYLITASRTTATVPGMVRPPSGVDNQLLLDGTMTSLCVKTVAVADFTGMETSTRTLVYIPVGATVKCDIRISLFAGEYSGPYKPYVDQTLITRMSNAETNIAMNSDAITLQAKKMEQSVNLLLDTDAPTTTKVLAPADRYWSDAGNTMITPTFVELSDPPESGIKYAAQFVCDGTQTSAKARALRFYHGTNNYIPLIAGQTYTATWWARCTAGSGKTRFSGTRNSSGNTFQTSSVSLDSTWRKLSATYTPESIGTYGYAYFAAVFDANTSGTVQLCGFKLVAGDSPENVSAELSVQADKISMVVADTSTSSEVVLTPEAMSYIGRELVIKGTDGTTTVISGGQIQTGSLTIGAMSSATQADILNSNIEVSATNLIRNGDFSNGTAYWVNQTNVTLSTETDSTYGTVLKAVQAAAGSSTARVYPDTSTNFTHATGETYSVSFYAKADAANTVKVDRGFSATDVYLNESIGTSWKRYTGTLTAGGTGSLSFSLGNAGTLYIAKVMLVRGDKYMDWSPDPRDVAASIASAQTTANTANNRSVAYRGTNNTASATAAKTVVCANFALAIGATISVYNQASNSVAGALTLNVNNTGAKTVYIGAEATSATNQLLWHIGSTITYTYDGTYWKVSDLPANYYGSSCSTAAGTARKQTTIPAGVIFKGVQLEVPMQYANTHPTPTLAVQNANSTASNLENSILYGTGSIVPLVSNGYSWLANMSVIFRFDGKNWRTGNQTIIDGGNILTGYIAADRIQSGSLAIGVLNSTSQNQILNSNIEVGGTNLVMGSGDYNGWIFNNAAVTKSGNVLDINVSGQTSNTFYRGRGWLSVPFATLKEIAPTVIVSVEVMSDDWSAVTSDSAAGFASASVQLCTVMGDIGTQTAGETKRYRYMGLNQTTMWQNIPAAENNKWLKFVSFPIAVPDGFGTDVSKGDGTNITADLMLRRNGHVKWRNLKVEAGNKATAWSPAPEDDANARRAIYGTCSTAAGTAAKDVTCANFQLFTGVRIAVKFSTANTVSSSTAAPQLNVNGTGAKDIWYNNAIASNTNPVLWGANATLNFVYDGTNWVMDEKPPSYSVACSTTASTRDKAATVAGALVVNGTTLTLNFSTANTYASNSVRINLSSTGATNIYYNRTATSSTNTLLWAANTTLTFVRQGAGWYLTDNGQRKYITHIDDNGIKVHAAANPSSNYLQLDATEIGFYENSTKIARFKAKEVDLGLAPTGPTGADLATKISMNGGMFTIESSLTEPATPGGTDYENSLTVMRARSDLLDNWQMTIDDKAFLTMSEMNYGYEAALRVDGPTQPMVAGVVAGSNSKTQNDGGLALFGGKIYVESKTLRLGDPTSGTATITRYYTSNGFAVENTNLRLSGDVCIMPVQFTATSNVEFAATKVATIPSTYAPAESVRCAIWCSPTWTSSDFKCGYVDVSSTGDVTVTAPSAKYWFGQVVWIRS